MSTISDIYKDDPTWEEFLGNIPRIAPSQISRMKMIKMFELNGFSRPQAILDLHLKELEGMEGLSHMKAKRLYEFNMMYKRKGKISWDIDDLIKMETAVEVMSSGSKNLDKVMPRGGIETQSIYEVVSQSGLGKTQLCMTIACHTMKMKKEGGLNRSVLWMDSQRDFSSDRLIQIAGNMTIERLKQKFHYSLVDSLDEIDYLLREVSKERWGEIGCIIIDSLILPIKHQYPIGGSDLCNLQPMQKHLIRLFRELKNLASRYNLVVIFTNTMKENIGYWRTESRFIPDGEMEIRHGADMRIFLDKANSKEVQQFGMSREERGKLIRANLCNSNRIPDRTGYFIIEKDGVCDPLWEEEVIFKKPVRNKKNRNNGSSINNG